MQPPSSSNDIDPAVIAAAQAGGTEAFEAIYRHYGDRIYTLVRRLTSRESLADDIQQEVFVEVLRSIGAYSGSGSFGGWLRAIAINKTLSYLRSPWVKRTLWLDAIVPHEAQALLDQAVADLSSASADGVMTGDQAALDAALEKLSPNARSVVWLHDVEGYTHQEIGKMLGGTASMSKSQLSRAHLRLRQLLTAPETSPCTPVSNSY
ncbi:MAG TPA: RNA polymerase sigma factor [Steroidobacteraceae bacterium]|nr:RNA polymerase sigma factor [Steroidobacteraceae bacterium]